MADEPERGEEVSATDATEAVPSDASEPESTPGEEVSATDATEAAPTDPATPDRSPSQQALHDDVRKGLFGGEDGTPTVELSSGAMLASRYRISALLGRGGMGEVYRAHDLVLDEEVALKFLPRDLARSELFMERFVKEVRIARQVTHPNVCRVHDIGEADGRRFLSMEYIDGEDLSSLLRRIGRLPAEKAIELAQQLCSGLAALHAQGLLHRDLKPSNVMIDGAGRLKLTDFGLAAAAAELEEHQLRDGTPAYMAPEQFEGKGVDVRSDLFALGLVIYELFSGTHAFTTQTRDGRSELDRQQPPARLASRIGDLPADVDEVVAACLATDPEDRPTSAMAVAAALPGGDPIAAALRAGHTPSVDAIANARKTATVPRWGVGVLLGFLLAVGVLVAWTNAHTTALGTGNEPLPVDVLRDRIEQMLVAAKIERPTADGYAQLIYTPHLHTPDFPEDPEVAPPLSLIYRAEPAPLVPYGPVVGARDPPLLRNGALEVLVDADGRLRRFQRVPEEVLREPGEQYDWTPLLSATGLPIDAAEPTTPRLTPAQPFDEQRAWSIPWPGLDEPARVEAASLRGRPMWLFVVAPWSPSYDPPSLDEATPEEHTSSFSGVRGWIYFGVIFVSLVVLPLFARFVRRKLDADRTGMFVIGTFVFLIQAAAVLLVGHFTSLDGGFHTMVSAVREAGLVAVVCVAGYAVLEPYGRRYLPGLMVSWTRFVRGRIDDPLVSRDILFGIAAGGLSMALAVPTMISRGRLAMPTDLRVLQSTPFALSGLGEATLSAVIGITQFFVLVLFLRVVLRSDKVAAGAFFVLWTLIEWVGHAPVGNWRFIVAPAGSALLTVAVFRYGFLTMACAQLVANLLAAFPLTLQLNRWYAANGLVGIVALSVFAALAARTALRQR